MPRIKYRIPSGVDQTHTHEPPLLSTQEGGIVALDRRLLRLWKYADGRDLEKIIAGVSEETSDTMHVRAGLACLAEAGLLTREEEILYTDKPESIQGDLVSVIIVGFNSKDWFDICLPSLSSQSYSPVEIIIVDNGSTDGTEEWVKEKYPDIIFIRLTKSLSLAAAINTGMNRAEGEYCVLLNPDVTLERDAFQYLVEAVKADPECAAVAAKLKFLYTPAFLNSLGNFVGAISWGVDNAIGHLDLGQYDSWSEVASACFAATLIPTKAWKEVGSLDEKFPLYYEDSEWCYRARLFGYRVKV